MVINVDFIRSLHEELPKNELGLPYGLYRLDLLPERLKTPEELEVESEAESEVRAPRIKAAAAATINSSDLDVHKDYPIEFLNADPDQAGEVADTLSGVNHHNHHNHLNHHNRSNGSNGVVGIDRSTGTEIFVDPQLAHAYVPLDYNEGFPTLPNGRAFWTIFDWEPLQAFQTFEAYLNQPRLHMSGVRQLAIVSEDVANGYNFDKDPSEVKALSYLYSWGPRAAAYDMFQTAAFSKQLEQRAFDTLDSQYLLANKLMLRLEEYLMDDSKDAEFWDLMNPKTAIDLLKTLTATQRVSVGLPANGPLPVSQQTGADSDKGKTLSVLFRSIAKQNNESAGGEISAAQDQGVLIKALEDPKTAELAQELVLKLG